MSIGTLHARLAVALLAVLLIAGTLNLVSILVTTNWHVQESNQRLSFDLARNIVAMKIDQWTGPDGEIRKNGLQELFHWLMVVNPELECYLLDTDGTISAYDDSLGPLERDWVSLQPIREALDGPDHLPIFGDDPRDLSQPEIFSVAPIPPEGPPRAYLYLLLARESSSSWLDELRSSYILRLSAITGVLSLVVSLVAGALLFLRITRPLRQLLAKMRSQITTLETETASPLESTGDEIATLESTFSHLTRTIEAQIEQIEKAANLRHELIANISHDLRTPIATLQGYLDTLTLKEDVLSAAEREEYLQIAQRQSARLGKLVKELFELTRLERHEIEPQLERFRIGELVQDNVHRFKLQAQQKGIELRALFDPDLPPVYADVGLMERALENLIENALRFTPPGGTVSVELRESEQKLELAVADTGPGIREEDLPRIFDRTYRSRLQGDSEHQGAGLGLAITRYIAELHAADLTVESPPGRGARFSMSLLIAPTTQQLALS